MKKLITLVLVLCIVQVAMAQQRVVAECTVDFTVSSPDGDAATQESMKSTTKKLYIKGTKSRTDLTSSSFAQTTLFDTKSDTAVVLRTFGNNKYMSYLDEKKWLAQHKKYEGLAFNSAAETKIILGYECKKMLAEAKDGSVYTIFYAPSIIPSNREFEYQFKDIPGFILEYEVADEAGKGVVKYTASKISFNPVLAQMFDLPKSGYRIL